MNAIYNTVSCSENTADFRERLFKNSLDSLSDSELATAIISGTAPTSKKDTELKALFADSQASALGQLSVTELMSKYRLNQHQASALAAALELGKRSCAVRQMCLTTPEATMCYLNDMSNLTKEHFRSLYLNTKKQLLKMETISIGDLSSSIAHPREVFYPAIQTLADSIIVAHNHPTGDPTPSETDLRLTRRLKRAGEILGITLVDHIIVGTGCYVSLRREGLI